MRYYMVISDEGDIVKVGEAPNLSSVYVHVDPRFLLLELDKQFTENPQEYYYDYVEEKLKKRDFVVREIVQVPWIAYETATGKVTRRGLTTNLVEAEEVEGTQVLYLTKKLDNLEEWYFNFEVGELQQRPVLFPDVSKVEFIADGTDEVIISGLPANVTVRINDVDYQVDDGRLTLTADIPAVYNVVIDQWPYMPWHVVLQAV